MITLSLPFPPSLNNMFFNLPRGGRAASKKYLLWQKLAGEAVREQAQEAISGRLMVVVTLGRPDKRRRDIDNYLKAPLDLLVREDLIDDDRDIETLSIAWGPVEGAVVRVWPMCAERDAIRALSPEGPLFGARGQGELAS